MYDVPDLLPDPPDYSEPDWVTDEAENVCFEVERVLEAHGLEALEPWLWSEVYEKVFKTFAQEGKK